MIEPRIRPSACSSIRLLGFDEPSLQPVGQMPISDGADGEFVDHLDAAVADDVIDVAAKQNMRVERAIGIGQRRVVLLSVEAPAYEPFLHAFESGASMHSTSRPYTS